jgi:hypothetical protein
VRAVAVATALLMTPAAAQIGPSGFSGGGGPSKLIAYACIGSDTIGHICLANITTWASAQITSGPCDDWAPEWSFDGLKIVFERHCGSGASKTSDIFIMNPDGTGVTQVTATTLAFTPTWTPAGKIVYSNIVFQPGPVFCTNVLNSPCSELRLINANGTGDTQLLASNFTNSSEVSMVAISSSVTPDGATVVFACGPYSGSWGGNGLQICTIPLATGNVAQTPTLLTTTVNAASSDPNVGLLKIGGQYQIVFDAIRPTLSAGNLNVYRMNLDGTGFTQLTSFVEPIEGQDGGLSPDMSLIPFEHDIEGGGAADVWVMNADGTGQHATGIACNPTGCKPRFRP